MFLDEMAHFVDVVQGKTAPRCTLEDGIRALKIALNSLGGIAYEKP